MTVTIYKNDCVSHTDLNNQIMHMSKDTYGWFEMGEFISESDFMSLVKDGSLVPYLAGNNTIWTATRDITVDAFTINYH